MVFGRVLLLIGLVTVAWTQSGWSSSDAPLCGDSMEDVLTAARQATNSSSTNACFAVAIERLAAHLEALSTGKEPFGTIKAEAYMHDAK